ncbi:MAG: rod shape-determining protein MreC [Bacteroidota bacterium]
MYRLLSFFSSNKNIIIFLILEGIALGLIISNNDRQKHVLGDFALELSGNMYEMREGVKGYFTLRERNNVLRQKIAQLEEQVQDVNRKLKSYEGVINRDTISPVIIDSLLSYEKFQFLPCRAIRNTTHKSYNYIMLDKGSIHGVKKDMGVISTHGIAGKVIKVTEHYAIALSAMNVSFKLSALSEGVGNLGLYEWGTEGAGKAYLNLIPKDAPLDTGQMVYTSGYNTIFPKGYKIGKIIRKEENAETGTYFAELELATDFYNLGDLYLVPAHHKVELDSLTLRLPDE